MKRKLFQRGAFRIALSVLLVYVVGVKNVDGFERSLPVVTTAAVTLVNNNVISGGNVIDDGGSSITARGICYGSLPNPDLSTTYTHTNNGTGTGSYTSAISLTSGIVYVRAYATNASGTAYGDQVTVNIDYLKLPRFDYNGLTYVVAPDPQPNYSEYIAYNTAYSYCENLTAYGYSDWKMPDIYELEMMWQYRESIGGFINGIVNTYNMTFYRSSTYYSSSIGHYILAWGNGQRTGDAQMENVGYMTVTNSNGTYYCRCHVRPVRVEIVVPTVTTNSVTNIHQTYATCGGDVTNNGGASVTERGICWSTNHLPTTYNSHTSYASSGTGSYSISIYDLQPGTQYYVRAYAINSEGTAYGDEVSFTTTSAPTVTTNNVTDITPTSATCGGNVTNEGSGTVTVRGVCWNTSPNPTISQSHTNNGTGVGSFTSNITGLIPGTQYYVRAYATNSEGTNYGEVVIFTTTNPPTVTTNNVTNITNNSATCGGNITNEGSGTVTARGVCWSINHNPTISDSHTNDGTGSGGFTSVISGLTYGTQYYIRAYATNSEGTAYGSEISFTTAYLHSVTTDDVTYITQTSAVCGGFVTNEGSETITARGVCWSTSNEMPTISDNHTSDGTGIGNFTSNLTGLTQNTTYYVRAYATCSVGTVYGETKQFTTTKLSYRISEGGVVATSAGGYFYDSGGPDDDYSDNENYIMTFTSNQGAGTKIQMTFTNFWTKVDDNLMIYNGINTSAPLIGTYYYNHEPGTVTATNSEGALTFVFISDNDYDVGYGWKAAISIVIPIDVSAYPFNGGTVSGGGTYTQGETCTLTATPASNYNFVNWTKNGVQVSAETTYTFPVTESASYVANFTPILTPTVTTNNVLNITYNSAACGGNVSNEGGGTVTARGVCWSTNHNPTISDNHTSDGVGGGNYTSNITGLSSGTQYYVRAYATNNEGTAYGDEVSFTTAYLHSVTTAEITYITQTSAFCGGYVTNEGSETITARGVCWSTSNQMPTLSDSYTSDGTGIGNFTSSIIGLTQNTTYYVRAYAISAEGTAYGETKQFTTTKLSYRISEGGVVATSAGGYFYDSGGPNSYYDDNEHYIMTFTSNQGAGTRIQMIFTSFSLYYNDNLVIYDGMNTSAPIIGTYSNSSPGTVTATNSDGALTFVFISNSFGTGSGWAANISIVTPSNTISVLANPNNGGTVTGGGDYVDGQTCALTAIPASGYSFVNWTKNGTVVSTNSNYSFTVTETATFVANFQQQTQNYAINISANPAMGGTVTGGGTYAQGATCTLIATANMDYTFVNWTENGNVVSTDATYSFAVTGTRTLVANFEVAGPITQHWTPIQNFENTMDGIGVVLIDGVEQQSFGLELGIFCDDECRGAVLPEEESGHWFYYFTMGGIQGESFSFRLYDHTANQELDLVCNETIPFEINGFIGDFDDPHEFLFSNNVTIAVQVNPDGAGVVTGTGDWPLGSSVTLTATANEGFAFLNWTIGDEVVSTDTSLTITAEASMDIVANFNYVQSWSLQTGWTWWSTYIELSNITGLSMLEEALGDAGVMIKTKNAYARVNASHTWYGSLKSINNETGYKIQTSAACDIAMTGTLATPGDHPITIGNGWNWIGYPVMTTQSPNAALTGFQPENKDVIKGQSGYARYDSNSGTWKPTSFTLVPGRSYLYYSNATESKPMTFVTGRNERSVETEDCHWTGDVHAFPDNNCILAIVKVDGVEQRDDTLELGAFVDGQCRGSVRLVYDVDYDRYFAMLTVTAQDGEEIHFGVFDPHSGEANMNCATRMTFESDAIIGDFTSPFEIDFATNRNENASMSVYPNPMGRNQQFSIQLPEGELAAEVTVTDATGVMVRRETGRVDVTMIEGLQTAGVYVVRVTCASGNVYHHKLVVK